jgi:hypothetical protein
MMILEAKWVCLEWCESGKAFIKVKRARTLARPYCIMRLFKFLPDYQHKSYLPCPIEAYLDRRRFCSFTQPDRLSSQSAGDAIRERMREKDTKPVCFQVRE